MGFSYENLLTYVDENFATNKLFKPVSRSTFKYKNGETNKFIDTAKNNHYNRCMKRRA
jgi:hypothetical protein